MTKIAILLFPILLSFSSAVQKQEVPNKANTRPKISFTFDDGITSDMPGYDFKTWNALILQHLEKEQVKAVFFVTGSNKTDEKGRFLLQSWNDAGHRIGNHTYSHPNYNNSKTTFPDFAQEFLRTDSIIRPYSQQLSGRQISHTLLLHHNLAAALFLDDLIAMFREKGWEIIPADLAFQDEIFKSQPSNVPAGESLIWALAKQDGKFESRLRYPAEDSKYEIAKMDSLGL